MRLMLNRIKKFSETIKEHGLELITRTEVEDLIRAEAEEVIEEEVEEDTMHSSEKGKYKQP